MGKPTVIFVPGAWHGPQAFSAVADTLQSQGFATDFVTLASVGAPTPLADFEPDVALIRAAVEKACDAGQDIMLLMHSYGSIPACSAIEGLEKTTRSATGKAGGVSHLIFCCAFVLPKDVSLFMAMGGKPLPWFDVSEDGMIVNPMTPEEIFYNDLDTNAQQKWVKALQPHSFKTMQSPVTYAALDKVSCAYVYCSKDNAIPLEIQKSMVESSSVNFYTETLDASHSPFLSMPDRLAKMIEAVSER